MGKKKTRSKVTSGGVHSSVNKNLTRAVRAARTEQEKNAFKINAWSKLQNPWITIANPNKEATNRRFIRVRANDLWGKPKSARPDRD